MNNEQQVLKEIMKLDKKIDVKITEIDGKVDLIVEKLDGTFNIRLQDHEKRIGNIEGYIKWGVLLVIGSVITTLLSLVIKT